MLFSSAIAMGDAGEALTQDDVQPLEASGVKAIHFKDGEKLQAGQVLIELYCTAARADNSLVGLKRSGVLSGAWCTQALPVASQERGGLASVFPAEGRQACDGLSPNGCEPMCSQLDADWLDTKAQLTRLLTVKEQIEKLQTTLPIVHQRQRTFQALQAQGLEGQHTAQDRTQERSELGQDLATLRAPVSSTLQLHAVHTIGCVVTTAQVRAEVTLENKGVGFLHLVKDAAIKLEPSPTMRHGTVMVNTITADAVTSESSDQPDKDGRTITPSGAVFPFTLPLAAHVIDEDGKAIRLASGVNLAAEVKTGNRRGINYLIRPTYFHIHGSIQE